MKSRIDCLLFLALVMAATAIAGQTNTLERLQQAQEKQQHSVLAQYGKALDTAMADLKKKGDLDNVLIVQAEQKRFEEEKTVPAPKDAKDSFRPATEAYCRATATLFKQYRKVLDELIKQEVTADRIEEAKLVKAEKDKADFMLADMQTKLPPPTTKKAFESNPPPAEKAGTVKTLDLGRGIKMDFVLIRPGSFMMGSSKVSGEAGGSSSHAHKVTITKPFYMGKYEVTQEQWKQVTGGNPSISTAGEKNPVENVSWNDCQAFLSTLRDKVKGMDIRLPTEAEWEYACRAASTTEFCYGDDERKLAQYGWFKGNSGETTHPVGTKKPNAWGLYDMHGSVWEWCSDWYGSYSGDPETDPAGPSSGSWRVIRGGSWGNDAGSCRSANRDSRGAAFRVSHPGLRVAVDVR